MWLKTVDGEKLLNTDRLDGFRIMPHESGTKWGVIAEPVGFCIGEYLSREGAIKAIAGLQDKLNNEREMSIYNGMVDLMHELREAIL